MMSRYIRPWPCFSYDMLIRVLVDESFAVWSQQHQFRLWVLSIVVDDSSLVGVGATRSEELDVVEDFRFRVDSLSTWNLSHGDCEDVPWTSAC